MQDGIQFIRLQRSCPVMTYLAASTMRKGATAFVACLLALFAASVPSAPAESPQVSSDSARLKVEAVGKQQILLKSGQHELAYFPDEGISVLSRKPLTFLMVAGN